MGQSSLWSISWLHHIMSYPNVTISAAQACESDDLRHTMPPFSVFLSSFSGKQSILGYVSLRRIAAVEPPKRGERRPHLWAAFGGAFELGQTLLGVVKILAFKCNIWRVQTLNWDTATVYWDELWSVPYQWGFQSELAPKVSLLATCFETECLPYSLLP